jgi:Secretion system C-terminal sorting domain
MNNLIKNLIVAVSMIFSAMTNAAQAKDAYLLTLSLNTERNNAGTEAKDSLSPTLYCQNSILPNGGFENNTVVTGGSNLNAGTTTNNWTIANGTPQIGGLANTGSYAAYMWGLGNGAIGSATWWGEGINNTGITYTTGQSYIVTFRAKHHNNITRPQLPKAQFIIGGTTYPALLINTPTWQTYTFIVPNLIPTNNDFIVRVINESTAAHGDSSSWIGIDDICVERFICPTIQVGITGKREICPKEKSQLCATVGGGVSPYTYAWSTGSSVSCTPIIGCPLPCSAIYTVIVTDANGCTASQTVSVSTLSAPTITAATATPSTITLGGSSTLSATATGATLYIWLPMGAIGSSTTVSPTATTTYTVIATDCGPCPARKNVTVFVKQHWVNATEAVLAKDTSKVASKTNTNFTNTDEIEAITNEESTNFIIIPNPTTNSFQIDLLKNQNKDIALLTLTDVLGKEIYTLPFPENNTKIDLATYPSGIYLLTIFTAKGERISQKVVKE